MSKLQNLEAVKELLKPYLGQYLAMQGVKYKPGMNFVCIDKVGHGDDWPGDGGSCGVIPGNPNLFHCFGCDIRGDIFLAAHLLENKPLNGKQFVIENLKYLANTFGIEMEDIQLTEEDLYNMRVKRAYADATAILLSSNYSGKVNEAISNKYEWKLATRIELGVGGIENFTAYMDRMTKQYGHEVSFLQEVDLANPKIFHQNNLIFTVCDAAGAPVGYAARSLTFEEDLASYEAKATAILENSALDEEAKKAQINKNKEGWPRKFHNTSAEFSKNKLYQKNALLYGFHLARKVQPPLFVFEGYADGTTARDRGMKNVSAIGSTAFTKEHVDTILNCGVKHLIIVLDGDKAGYTGTDRAVKIIEEAVGDRVGLKVELMQMPEGSDDPDRMIRLYGVEEFEKIPRLDIFSWKVKRQIQSGSDPILLANEAVPLIVNEPNFLLRLSQIKKLAQVTGVDEEYLRNEVTRRVDQDSTKMREEITLVVARMSSDLKRKPDAAMEIMRQAMSAIEVIDHGKTGYDPSNILSAYESVFEKQMSHLSTIEIKTGWPIFDKKLGGIPKGEAFISKPGKPNHGKSSTFSNLSWRIPDNNNDVVTVYHTMDDSLGKAIPRILGAKYQLPSKLFKMSGYFLKNIDGRNEVAEKWPQFPSIYNESQAWLKQMIQDERLILTDINTLPPSLPALEGWLKTIRRRFPHDAIVCMGDNFSQYQLDTPDTSESSRAKGKSQFIKRLANTYQACMMITAELAKDSLKPGVRPRVGNIISTQGVAYDSDCSAGIYNDLKDRNDAADLVWLDPHEIVPTMDPDSGCVVLAPRRKPILEMVIDKNKLSDFDGSIFFEFDMVSAELRECNEADQAIFRERAAVVTSKSMASSIGGSNAPNKIPF